MASARQPQLDGVRATAVTLVLWQHTMRPAATLTRDAGAIGVVLFFVLSGFLITGILLDARRDADAVGEGRGGVLRRFYIRRFLRIFPLYYAVLVVAWLLGEPQVRHYIGWLGLYATNFLMASVGDNIGMPTPFWSLAVEEQFYLFWPFIVLFLPRRYLPRVLGSMVIVSVLSRMLIALNPAAREHTVTMPTWSALDGLAIGGMLALAHRSASREVIQRVLRWVLAAGAVLMSARLAMIYFRYGRVPYYALWMLPWAMIGAWAVDKAARNELPGVLAWRPIAWVGIVSYGVYVYHRPLMSVLSIGNSRGWMIFALVTSATVVVASASWILFERPINDQKRRWPYVPRRAAADEATDAGAAADVARMITESR
jgi:peptidoglycan/LPS O-acetylase OafA/YrhL